MRETSPFFYDALVNQLVHPAARPAVHLWGGRALGKTTVLHALRDRLVSASTPIIEGSAVDATAQLEEAVAAERFPIFIDDLDLMLRPETAVHLDRLAQRLARHRVVFTSTLPPHFALLAEHGVMRSERTPEEVRVWSSITLQFDSKPLDPWLGDWRRRVVTVVGAVLGRTATAAHRDAWAAAVTQLTGGHPVLLDVACAELPHAAVDLRPTAATPTTDERRAMQRRIEEPLFRSGLRRLRRVYADLRERAPRAHDALLALARGLDDDPSAHVKDLLIWSGLVVPETRGLMVAGELLQRALLETDVTPPPALHLAQVGATSEQRGVARVMVGGAWKTVDLRGAAWTILDALHARRDRVLSVSELMTLTNFENEAAFRSALQRLRNEFLAVGVDNIIVNVWGHGYALGQPLLVIADTARGRQPIVKQTAT